MRVLVDDFLNSAVIESGKFQLDLQLIDIRNIIERAVVSQSSLATSRHTTLNVFAPETVPKVRAEADKIEQVLNNFISNAIEYSPERSVVEIQAAHSDKEIAVSVRDNGAGLAPEEIDKLFRPFATTGARKGSGRKSIGLGLFISKKIIEAHGGRVWATSTQGVGSTFCFSLPIP